MCLELTQTLQVSVIPNDANIQIILMNSPLNIKNTAIFIHSLFTIKAKIVIKPGITSSFRIWMKFVK